MARTILVVDDDAMNLRMAEFILKKKGYLIDTAKSGQECLQKIAMKPYDLILLDIEMPLMNGIATLTEIRKKPEFLDLPVAFLTADTSASSVTVAVKLGAKAYIQKPFVPDDLYARVVKLIGE